MIFFFFNDTATTEIYTLSLHDALPISLHWLARMLVAGEDPRFIARRIVIFASEDVGMADPGALAVATAAARSEEHTSELQSRQYLVCRLLLEKKKKRRHFEIRTSINSM